jgi:hypothetical protein
MRSLNRRIRGAVAFAAAALLLAAGSASAATQRYASPTGSGYACSTGAPCAITKAIGDATTGDEVIIAPGDYPLHATLATPGYITVHGLAGLPRPRLLFSGAGQDGLEVIQSNLRYVEVDQAADAIALSARVAGVDQAVVAGAGPRTADVLDSTIRNSVVVASQPGATAVSTWELNGAAVAGTYRNVTAVTTGGVAISADAGLGGSAKVIAKNVIAVGTNSLKAAIYDSGSHATITTIHCDLAGAPSMSGGSNAVIASAGGDISGSPAFENPAAGDYREAPGSPTIDAGMNDPLNGPFDLGGDPRMIASTDIGADEFVVAPAASTGPASAVSPQSATLTGTVNPNGDPTTYRFEYGPSTAYGNASSTNPAGAGSAPVAASATVAALSPSTTYHYRITAINGAGAVQGADHTFTTAAGADHTFATAAPPTPYRFAGVTLASRTLPFSGRYIKVTLRCPAGTAVGCAGQAKLTARHGRTAARRVYTVKLGHASFTIAAGKQFTVRVWVSRSGLALYRGVRRLRARATVSARDGADQSNTTTAVVTIKRRIARH